MLRIKHKNFIFIWPGRFVGSLTARVLAINILALAILAAGFMYLDKYQDELLSIKSDALKREGQIIARSLIGEIQNISQKSEGLNPFIANTTLQRLAIPYERRVRLFLTDGSLVADSYTLPGTALEPSSLPPPSEIGAIKRIAFNIYDWAVGLLPPHRRGSFPSAPEQPSTDNFAPLAEAIEGQLGSAIYETKDGKRTVLVALPLQSVKRVQGALIINSLTDDIDRSVRDVRFALIVAFFAALLITILLSLYLARTITRPVRRLAKAADTVSAGLGEKIAIPDFSKRQDEIGILSASLSKMTDTMWSRMDAIENFVADVAHEIKNPLTSLRSAVETVRKIKDNDKRNELLDIIASDVIRMDRLLSEIADASRIDTELSRKDPEIVNIREMLETLLALHQYHPESLTPKNIKLIFSDLENYESFAVPDRMAQVFQNLIDNGISFSPPDGEVNIILKRKEKWIEISVIDSGPGVPEIAREKIFERFYTDRNEENSFGSHSGLGLAIAKQIVIRHGGSIEYINAGNKAGLNSGAEFKVRLLAAYIGDS